MQEPFDDELRRFSQTLLNKGVAAAERGDLLAAQAAYIDASKDDTYFAPWLNLGLLYKTLGRFDEAFDAFKKCWGRLPVGISADLYAQILWNLGISATVLQQWNDARWAWTKLQYRVYGELGGPPTTDGGEVVLRMPDGSVERAVGVDPCRACLRNRPNLVYVHDAQRVGTSELLGSPSPIFPVLAVHENTWPEPPDGVGVAPTR